MKVCIISHTEKNYLPYMDKYTHFFLDNDIEYDIIYWSREERPAVNLENEFCYYEVPEDTFFGKFKSYLRYKKFIIKKVRENRYDKLVILTTTTAIFLRKLLKKYYKNKYIFDFRDYSFEKFKPYKKLVDNIIEDSEFTTISSKGFMDFLAENKKIVKNHNIPLDKESCKAQDLREKQVINIGFVGGVRYYDENALLLNALKNTFRYQLWYIGKPTKNCDLQKLADEHAITNVSFIGKYLNSQKAELYKNIDIINSIYGNNSLEVTTALPNRLYEACLYKKPIISSKGTYLGEVINYHGLGVVLDVDKDPVLDIINEYIDTFDCDQFSQNCDKFLNIVKDDEEKLYHQLKKFIV